MLPWDGWTIFAAARCPAIDNPHRQAATRQRRCRHSVLLHRDVVGHRTCVVVVVVVARRRIVAVARIRGTRTIVLPPRMRSASSSSSSNCSSFPPNIDPSIAGSPPLFPPSSPPPPKPMGPVRIVTMLAAAGRVASSAWPASRPLAPRRGYRYLPRTMTPRPRGDRHHCRGTARGTDVAPYVFPLLHVLRAPIVHEYVSEYPTPSLLRRHRPRKHGGTVPPARASSSSSRVDGSSRSRE